MAITPRAGRGAPRKAGSSSTLSASEALKAAEAAIEAPTPRKAPAARKAIAANPVAEKKASDTNPLAVIMATTATDALPEPDEAPEVTAKPVVIPPEAAAPEITLVSAPAAAPVEPKINPVLKGSQTMNDVMETGKKFAEDAKVKMETAYADMNEKAKASVEKSTKAIEEMSDIAKGNVEAIVESGKIAAKAVEAMGQEAVDYSRKNFEKATASLKSLSSVKTPTEFFQLQSQLLSSSFDEFTKEAAKSSEAMMKLVGDIASPLTARVAVVTDKVKSLAA